MDTHLKLWSMLVNRRTQSTLVFHVKRVLEHAHPPHVLPVLGAGQRERDRLSLLLAFDAECAFVIYDICDIHPPDEQMLCRINSAGLDCLKFSTNIKLRNFRFKVFIF